MSQTPPPAEPETVGRMIVDLIPNGTSRPVPKITFDPVGSFTPGLIDAYTPLIGSEILKAQAQVRHELRKSARKETV